MTFRDRIHSDFQTGSKWLWLYWIMIIPFMLFVSPVAGVWVLFIMWLGRQPVQFIGMHKPDKVPRLVLHAMGLSVILFLLVYYCILPLVLLIPHAKGDFSLLSDLPGNWSKLLLILTVLWVAGGFLEEIAYRGFLLEYGIQLLGRSWTWPLIVLSGILFGLSHISLGIPATIASGIVGIILGSIYVLSAKNLWLVILIHGFLGTFMLFAIITAK